MKPLPGDRIVVTGEMKDPAPIQIGTTGTVIEVTNEGTAVEQVWVDWDPSPNGEHRSLMLTPRDYRIIRRLAPDDEEEKQ